MISHFRPTAVARKYCHGSSPLSPKPTALHPKTTNLCCQARLPASPRSLAKRRYARQPHRCTAVAGGASPFTFETFKSSVLDYEHPVPEHRKLFMVHAHAYFPFRTDIEQQAAKSFRRAFMAEFSNDSGIVVSAIDTTVVEPHPLPNIEIAFITPKLAEIVPWLMFNRPEGFSILLHPFTDRFVEDHTSRAAWLGKQLECPLTEFGNLQEQFDADIAGGKNKTVEMWKAIKPVDDIGSGASMKGHAIET